MTTDAADLQQALVELEQTADEAVEDGLDVPSEKEELWGKYADPLGFANFKLRHYQLKNRLDFDRCLWQNDYERTGSSVGEAALG